MITAQQGHVIAEICILFGAVGLALVLVGLPRIVQSWLARRVVAEAEEITATGDIFRLARHVEVVRE